MRNLIKVATRFKNNNIDKLTTRLPVNYGLRQFSDVENTQKKPHADQQTSQNSNKSMRRRSTNDVLREFDAIVEALEKSQVNKPKLPIDKSTSLAIAATRKFESKRGTMLGKYLRVLDEETARKFADLVISKPAENAAYVAELNPGFGLITTRLLDAGIPTINLFESLPHFHPILESLAERYPGRVNLKKIPFDHLWRIGYTDWLNDTNQLPAFLEGLDRRKSSEEPTFHVIGALTDLKLIVRYMTAIVFHNSLAKYGRVILHVAMPPSVWNKLAASNAMYHYYTSRTVMFQILFHYELLGTLPRAGFFPKYPKRLMVTKPYRKHLRYDKTLMCVVRIEAKNDLYTDEFKESDIVPFFFFIKHHLKRRKNRIIPELEKWVPGCGRDLIAAGFNVTTEFGELLPPELLKLFLLFKSWPGYKKSSFITMIESFEKRLDEQIVFGTSAEKVDEMFKLSRDSTNAQAELKKLNDANKSSD